MNQDAAFEAGEADAYWRRNQHNIANLELRQDFPVSLITAHRLQPQSVLEVGAADGYRLQWIHYLLHPERTVAVEPSAEAIAYGRSVAPWIHFLQSTAADMDLHGEQFNLVIVHYVLHWVDRSRLMRSVANIDEAVNDGGYLLIGDFYPDNRTKVPYHHKPGLYTFKQDYARLFCETGLYHAVAMLTSGHGDKDVRDAPEQERYACWLLRKSLTDHYTEYKGV